MSDLKFLLPGQTLKETGTSMIVYGDPGVGKTSLIKTLLGWEHPIRDKDGKLLGGGWVNEPYCTPEEIFVVDVESGLEILKDKDGKLACTVYPVTESLDKFKDMVTYLVAGQHPFKYVFVDNMSELEKYILLQRTKIKELSVPRQKEWGDSAFFMRKAIRDLRNLTYNGVNVIFNFWSMAIPLEEGVTQVCPMVMKSTTMEYVGLVGHTAYMGIAKASGNRFLQFESKGMYKAKTRCERINTFEEANLATIFRKIKGEPDDSKD